MNLRQWLSPARAVLGIMHGSRAFGGPLQADLRFTGRCNIRCIHCYFHSPHVEKPSLQALRKARKSGAELPKREDLKQLLKNEADSAWMRTLIEQLLKMGTRRYQIGGTGEPFLWRDALEISSVLKHAGSYCLANTNGTLLDRYALDELIGMQFDDLRITTMAGTDGVYKATHPVSPKGTFTKIEENLLYLAERKAALGVARPMVTLCFVVVRQNVEDIYKFARFAARVGAERVLYRPVDDVQEHGLARVIPTEKQADSVKEQLKHAEPYLESKGVWHNIRSFRQVYRQRLDTKALHQLIPCYYGWLSSVIESNGEVYPCCRCYESLGNAVDRDFHEVWHGKSYSTFRRESLFMNRLKRPVKNCDCYNCVHYSANLRVFKALHPVKGRSHLIAGLSPSAPAEEE